MRLGLLAIVDQSLFSGTNFLTAVLVGRFGGPAELGAFSLAFSLVMLAVALQRSLFVSPFVVLCGETGKPDIARLRATMLRGTFILSLVTAAGCLVAFAITRRPIIAVLAFAIPAGLARDFVRRLSIAEMQVAFATGIDSIIGALQLVGLGCFAFLPAQQLNATEALGWCSLVWLMVGLGALAIRWKIFVAAPGHFAHDFRRLWEVGRWIGLSQVTSTVQAFAMPWVMAIGHSVELAGVYTACWSITQVVSPAIEGFGNILGPAFAKSAARRDWHELSRRLTTATLIYSGMMVVLVMAVALLGRLALLTLYGPSYANYLNVLLVVTLAAALGNVGIPPGKCLTQLGSARANSVVSVVALLVVVGSSLGLLRIIGPTGAAWGLVCGSAVSTAARWLILLRRRRELLADSQVSGGDRTDRAGGVNDGATRPSGRGPSAGVLARMSGENNSMYSPLRRWIRTAMRYDIVMAATLLALVSFSIPGREMPGSPTGLDAIALAKLAIRAAACAWFGAVLFWQRIPALGRTDSSPGNLLTPWHAYLVWALMTIAWSPLKVVSLGQWLGFAALVALAQVIRNRYAGQRREQMAHLILSVYLILTAYSGGLLLAHAIAPEMSGLNRSITFDGSNGLVHPTAAGATASLGVVWGILSLGRLAGRASRGIALTLPVHLAVLYLANSRAALAMAIVSVMCYGLMFTTIRERAWGLLVAGAACLGCVLVDPGFELAASAFGSVRGYVSRGQTDDQLLAVSGRTEMWQAVWEQFVASPVIGHGYFVTSATGKLDVWDGPDNHDAHNIVLQVLVTTGLVGGALFAWAVYRSGRAVFRLLYGQPNEQADVRALARFSFILCVWFLGWSQSCVTFLGPVRPESVVFFVMLGLVAASTSAVHSLPAPRAKVTGPES